MTSASLYVIPDKDGLSTLLFHIRAAHDGFHEDVMASLKLAFATFKAGFAKVEFDVQPYTDLVCSHIVAANPNWWTVQDCIDMNTVDDYPEDEMTLDEMIQFCLEKLKERALSSDIELTITVKSDEKNPAWIVDYWDINDETNKQIIIN